MKVSSFWGAESSAVATDGTARSFSLWATSLGPPGEFRSRWLGVGAGRGGLFVWCPSRGGGLVDAVFVCCCGGGCWLFDVVFIARL